MQSAAMTTDITASLWALLISECRNMPSSPQIEFSPGLGKHGLVWGVANESLL